MKQLHVWLTDEQAKELNDKPNKSEYVRTAIDMYNGYITTDSLAGMRNAFRIMAQQQQELCERFVEQYELVERLAKRVDELAGR